MGSYEANSQVYFKTIVTVESEFLNVYVLITAIILKVFNSL